jgi:spore germination cell wall hydrolase CwlJ-like protein
MIGVGVTVRTRVQHPCWWGRNWREVILRDGREDNPHDAQFSCWQDANAAVIRESRQKQTPLWKMMMGLAIDIYTGKTADAIGGPTHYHTPLVFPDWAAKMKRLCTLGNHIFYRDIGQEGEYRA